MKKQEAKSDTKRSPLNLRELLNDIAAGIPMLDKSDLSDLAQIQAKLRDLSLEGGLPSAFIALASRTAKLAERMIAGDADFGGGCSKLGEAVDKMRKYIEGLSQTRVVQKRDESMDDEWDNTNPPEGASLLEGRPSSVDRARSPDDLLLKFAAQQQSTLEEFEVCCIEFEKGSTQAMAEIKRRLHTLKGELGVLDLSDYSKLIHGVEECIENDRMSADALLKLKDFLAERFSQMATGTVLRLQDATVNLLIQSLCEEKKKPSEKPPQGSEPVSAPGTQVEETMRQESLQSEPVLGGTAFTGDPSIVKDFITEARDHLDKIDPLLLNLETEPTNADHLNSVVRGCHTINGVSSFLGMQEIQLLAHNMESLMDQARKGTLTLSFAHIDLLLEAVDCMRGLINSVEGALGGASYFIPGNFQSTINRLSMPPPIQPPMDRVHAVLPEKKIGEILAEDGSVSPREIEDAFRKQQAGDMRKLGEILIAEKGIPARDVGAALASQIAGRAAAAVEETIKVPITRLDQLIDAIGEAVIAQSMVYADSAVRQTGNNVLEKKIAHAALVMRQIQELSMSLRMISIKPTFQKMARLVRDLSKKMEKDVEFIMEGEDTEIDKSVVENISDPLIHMIRNSLDHGIESTEDRTAAGKPTKSRITLRAYHKAGNVCIEIEDDGQGLDVQAILQKAIQKGLCKADARPADSEICQFIFMPGFSTAKVVTDISGRGVGMDVVRKNIQALRGVVDIHTEAGKGTRFTIRLPLTLAIINGMIVKLDNQRYIVPTLSILESIKPREDQILTVIGKGEMVEVRGDLLRLARLAEIFEQTSARQQVADGIILIVEDALGKRVGLLVDDIIDQQQVVIKKLGDGIGDMQGIAGGAIMTDGSVSLILDIGEIIRLANQ